MVDKDLMGSKGLKIVSIDCDNTDFKVTKLSDLGDNWEIASKCPTCNRIIYFHKSNVNKVITCTCGQNLKVEIPQKLL